jgi:O-antigen/teichoic acid export membrane protein
MRIFSGIRLTVFLQIVYTAIYATLTLWLAWQFGASTRAYLSVYNTTLYFSVLVAGLGLSSAITFYIAQNRLLASQVLARIIFYCFSMFTVILLAFYLAKSCNVNLRVLLGHQPLLVTCVAFTGHLTLHVAVNLCAAVQAARQELTSPLITLVAQVLLTVILVYSLRTQISAASDITQQMANFSCAMALAYAVPALAFVLYTAWCTGFQMRGTMQYKSVLSFAGLSFAANLVQTISLRSDIWFLNYYQCGTVQLGSYSMAALVIQMLAIIPGQVGAHYFARASSKHSHNPTDIANLSGTLLWYCLVLYVLGAILSNVILPVIIGNSFQMVTYYIAILLPGAVLVASSIIISGYNAGTGNVRRNLVGSCIGALVCILGYTILIPQHGAVAAAAVSAAAYTCVTLYYYFRFAQQHKIPFSKLFTTKHLVPTKFKQLWTTLFASN